MQGKGDGTFATTASTFPTTANPVAFGLGDFNSDGKPDAVVVSQTFSDSTVAVQLNNSTPGLPTGNTPTEPTDPTPTAPSLSATIGTVTLPTVFVPGDKGTAQVVLTNAAGAAAATGQVTIALYASTDATYDAGDALLDTGVTLANKPLRVAAGGTKAFVGKFVVLGTLASGAYYLVARVTPSGFDGAAETTAASTSTFIAATSFGTVGGRANVKYAFTDADGTLVTYALTGPGTGTITTTGSDVSLVLDGTSAASKFTATTKGGDGAASLTTLTVNGAIGTITGKTLGVTSGLTAGDVTTIALQTVTGAAGDVAITLTGSTPVTLTAGTFRDVALSSTAPFKSLTVAGWTDAAFATDTVTAPSIAKLTSGGAFAPTMTLFAGGTALGSASIAGDLTSPRWTASGAAGAIKVGGSVSDAWSGSFAGAVKSVAITGNFAGDLAATDIAAFTVRGNVADALLRAGGTFGADGVAGTADDTYGVGTVRKLAISGGATASRFFAGTDAADAPLPGGAFGTIAINGPVDSLTTFVAATLPAKAKLGGASITTADDPRFLTTAAV